MSYPRMLYRKGGETKVHGHEAETLTVNDEAEELAAFGDGWGFYEDLFGSGDRAAPCREVETEAAGLRAELESTKAAHESACAALETEREARQAAETERDQARDEIADMKAQADTLNARIAELEQQQAKPKKGGAASAEA